MCAYCPTESLKKERESPDSPEINLKVYKFLGISKSM